MIRFGHKAAFKHSRHDDYGGLFNYGTSVAPNPLPSLVLQADKLLNRSTGCPLTVVLGY